MAAAILILAIYDYSDDIFGLDQQNYRAIAIMDDTSIVVGSQNNGAFIRINTSAATGSYVMLNNGHSYRPKYHTLNSPQIYNAICSNGNNVFSNQQLRASFVFSR